MRSKRLKRNNHDAFVNNNDTESANVDDQLLITSLDSIHSTSSPATVLRRKSNKNCRNQTNSPEKNHSLETSGEIECPNGKNQSKNIELQGEVATKQTKRLLRFRGNSNSSSASSVKMSSHVSSNDTESSAGPDQMTYSNSSKLKGSEVKVIANVNSNSSPSSENSSNTSSAVRSSRTYLSMPKSTLTLTSVPRKTYGISAKFIVDLPELSDCTGDPSDTKSQGTLTLLPDRICLLHADLPLKYLPKRQVTSSSQIKPYAYRQILSPDSASHSCLLCLNATSLTVNELKNHYSSLHELHCEVASIKFPDDVIYACLPKETFDTQDGTIIVNCPCQYCENTVLDTLTSMVDHYAKHHNNKVSFVEQESVLNMHKYFYCFTCNEVKFTSFKQLNEHMKSEHKMQTYPCRECNFFTREEVRLKSHFKAKHMLNSSNQQAMQCLECSFCNGLLMGRERMNRHIQSTHCIETSQDEYSCLLCHEIAGTCDSIINHMSKCPSLRPNQLNKWQLSSDQCNTIDSCVAVADNVVKTTATVNKVKSGEAGKILPESNEDTQETSCFICCKSFDSVDSSRLHMSHVHTKWIKRKSELENIKLLVSHLPTSEEMKLAGVTSNNGFYCHFCETVIQEYCLFYLHMSNLHKMRKVYQCKVSSCHEIFYSADELKQHSESSQHPQKSIIEDTLGAICCHFCDEYFKDRKEFELHHLTDQHNIRVPSCKSYTSGRQEARNYKCKMCHTWFGLTDSFIYHMENETHKHSCPYCGIDFALPSSRRTHIQSHHTDKADICEICSIKQGSKERLYPHLVTHGIMFECNTCIKVFYQKEQLNCHLETHAPLVSCHWTGCERKVASSSLSLHIKQHRVQANSKCKTCGKVFSSPYLLENHHEVHVRAEEKAMQIMQVSKQNAEPLKNGSNVKKTITCNLCSQVFTTQAALTLHSNKCNGKRAGNNHQTQSTTKSTAPTFPLQSSNQSIDVSLMDTYLIQNPDGTIVELRVPAGMDFNEALNSLTVATNNDASSQMFTVSNSSPPVSDKSVIDTTTLLSNDPLDVPHIAESTAAVTDPPCEQLIYIAGDNLPSGVSTDSQEIVSYPLNSETLNLLTTVATSSSSHSVIADCF